MNTKGTIQNLLDELVVGNPHSAVIQTHMDVILTWLARPDSEKVKAFRTAYLQRNISEEILRGYVLFILEQRLFSTEDLPAHQVLALPLDATKEQVKSRYQKLIRIYHPDRGIGDPRILHQHAEKINQAYQHLIINNASTNRTRPSYSVKASPITVTADPTGGFVATAMSRKLRSKLGNAKQFQMLFFGSVFIVCLLLILLLYIQSDAVDSERSYSKKIAQTGMINQANNVSSPVEEEKSEDLSANNTLPTSADFEGVTLRNTDSKPGDDSIENATMLNPALVELETFDEDLLAADKLADQKLEEAVVEQVSEINLVNDSSEVKEKIEAELIRLLSQGIDGDSIAEDDRNPVLTKQIEPKPHKAEQDALLAEKSNSKATIDQQQKKQTVLPGKVFNKNKSKSNQVEGKQSGASEKASQKTVEIEMVESKAVTQKSRVVSQQTSGQAQIEEIQVSKIIKPTQNHSVANLFERRFARKFVIKYLESIEQGNISLLSDFLADGLSVNGVANNKHSHLKNTTQMISDSDRRSYRINFVGDVLRLDKGSFRVTLKEHQTVIFKNNRKTQANSTKSYVIKRYSYGSEIVSISDV